jgi:hypothetical protein
MPEPVATAPALPSMPFTTGARLSTRRQFIQILPLAGIAALAACSKTAPEPPKAAEAPPAPAPAAPAAAAPAADPAPAPAAAPPPAPTPAPAPAAAAVIVDEKDPVAMSVGYVTDAARVDKAKYKQYVEGRHCGNCALFAGKAGDATGPCPIMAGRLVNAKGWCSAHVPKPA